MLVVDERFPTVLQLVDFVLRDRELRLQHLRQVVHDVALGTQQQATKRDQGHKKQGGGSDIECELAGFGGVGGVPE